MENFGYIPIEQKPSDWLFGGQGEFFSPLNSVKLIDDHNWFPWLPVVELQNNGSFDRMACVTFSDMNTLEIINRFKTGKELNWSDRYIAKLSGTTKQGNNVAIVFDTIREYGLIPESEWPDVGTSWDEYYKTVPQSLIDEGKKFISKYDLYREYVPTSNKDAIFEALNYAPLQVIVKYCSGDGILNPVGNYNHAVTCYGAVYGEYWMIFDHYTQTLKKYAWGYEFGCIIKPTFNIKQPNMFKPENNFLYQLTQGEGGFAMGLNGKLVIDSTDKILASVIMRNGGDTIGKTRPLTLDAWNSVPHVNLKGEKI